MHFKQRPRTPVVNVLRAIKHKAQYHVEFRRRLNPFTYVPPPPCGIGSVGFKKSQGNHRGLFVGENVF